MHLRNEYALGDCNCKPRGLGFLGEGVDWVNLGMSAASSIGGGSGSSPKEGGSGGGSQSTVVGVTTTTATNISPQISPQFIQQQSPTNSPINAGINPMPQPGMGAPATGFLPGFDSFPFLQSSGGVNPLMLGAGALLLAAIVYKARRGKKTRRKSR